MPRKTTSRRVLTPLLLFTIAGWALWALGRNAPAGAGSTGEGPSGPTTEPGAGAPARPRAQATWSKRRLATSLTFAALFFGGAAFSAGAGDLVGEALEGDTTTEQTSTEEAPEAPPAEEPAPAPAPAPEPPAEPEAPSEPETPSEPAPSEPETPSEPEAPGGGGGGPSPSPGPDPGDGGGAPAPSPGPPPAPGLDPGAPPASGDLPVLEKNTRSSHELDPEAEADGFFATIWLHRTLPDPTPPAKRLDSAFAKLLAEEAKSAGVEWAALLGVLRAQGFTGTSMNRTAVRGVARRLAALEGRGNLWNVFLGYRGRPAFADRALALTRYNRAVGLRALVTGLTAAKPRLQKTVLADSRLDIYPGGRLDIAMGRTDIRVLVLLRYLGEAHRQVTISSLTTGHRVFSRPGVVSAHTYGLAVDIAALEGRSIVGNQAPGGLTERAVRNILLLPAELQPKQVISLLGLGGPSFPLADHDDHIHVGY
jgi:hypothetical protein